MTTMSRPPARHLVTDELVEMPDRAGTLIPFRVRIWLGAEATPLVLVSQHAECDTVWSGPSMMTSKIANYVNSLMIGYNPVGMLYYEDEMDAEGDWHLSQCDFEFYGNTNRLKMYRPTRKEKPWGLIDYIVGDTVERHPC